MPNEGAADSQLCSDSLEILWSILQLRVQMSFIISPPKVCLPAMQEENNCFPGRRHIKRDH